MCAREIYGKLQLEEDMGFQRREWVVQQVAWAVLVLLLVAALLGLLGGQGPLSETTSVTPDGAITLNYRRFERVLTPYDMKLEVNAPTPGEQVRVAFDRNFIEQLQIESIMPDPELVQTSAEMVTYQFAVMPESDSAIIQFSFTPQQAGVIQGRLEVEAVGSVDFTQFVYP